MDFKEMVNKEVAIASKYERAKLSEIDDIRREYCKDNCRYKVGDIFTHKNKLYRVEGVKPVVRDYVHIFPYNSYSVKRIFKNGREIDKIVKICDYEFEDFVVPTMS